MDTIYTFLSNNIVSIISLGISIIVLYLFWKNRKGSSIRAVRQTLVESVDRLTKRYQPSQAIAYLRVINGDKNTGTRLEIFGDTPIGRSIQVSEMLFQQDDEYSPISRLQCTILYEEDHFLIRDEDSSNGTYLNGIRLQPLVAEKLFDGDEIELARIERGGVRLQFLAIQEADVLSTGMIITKPGMIITKPSLVSPLDDNDDDTFIGDRF